MPDTDIVTTSTGLASQEPMVDINTALAHMTPEQLEAKCAMIEKVAAAHKRLVLAAVTRTYNHDWRDFGGTPYLEGNGAERLASIGIRISEPIFDVHEEGDDYFVECMVEAAWPAMDRATTGLGDCNTQDKFFKGKDENSRAVYRQYLDQTGGNERLAKRMLLGSVKKKAHQNAISRAVRAVMGIRGLTWDDLKEMGITKEGAGGSVTYKSRGKQASATTDPSPAGTPAAVPTEAPADPAPRAGIPDDAITIAQLLALPLRTPAACVVGEVVCVAHRTRTNTWTLNDGTGEVEIMVWGENGASVSPPPEWATGEKRAHAMARDLYNKEYRGKRQFTAQMVTQVAEPDDGDTPFQ